MSVYNKKVGIGKQGVNYLRTITDENECYFHEIVQENDVGIDAFIEFTKNGKNDGRCIAVQIKTGNSFFNTDKTMCKIPIGSHYNYWKNHSLQVYGIVCDLERKDAFWISITEFICQHDNEISNGKIQSISFPVMKINTLNTETFGTIFKPMVYGLLPKISFKDSLLLSQSSFVVEKALSIDLLLRVYTDDPKSWDRCFTILNEETTTELLSKIAIYFSYASSNPDLWGKLDYSKETEQYVKKRLQEIDKTTIIKLLSLTDDGIERGTIGQCIESILSIVQNNRQILSEILEEHSSTYIGINALFILAYYDPESVVEQSKYYISLYGEQAETIVDFIKKFKGFDLY